LADALSLVRGLPFAGVPSGSYGWADRRDLGDITGSITNAVHKAAVELARLSLDARDYALAAWATDRGLLLWELEGDLIELSLSAAAIDPDRSALSRVWATTQRHFASHGETVPDSLHEHYNRLKERGQES
jgi:hypothetical protein